MGKAKTVNITPEGWGKMPDWERTWVGAAMLSYVARGVVQDIRFTRSSVTVVMENSHLAPIVQRAINGLCGPRSAAEEKALDHLAEICCGDNSCYYLPAERRGGMRTNGGCRCIERVAGTQEVRLRAHELLHAARALHEARLERLTQRMDAAVKAWDAAQQPNQ